MDYSQAKTFRKTCRVVSGLTTSTAESLVLEAPDGTQWYWFDSFLEYPENGWSLTSKTTQSEPLQTTTACR